MNKTKIEWCDRTWNPVTGCLHGCPYCYAKKIAQRFGGDGDCFVRDYGKVLYGKDGLHEIDVPTVWCNCPDRPNRTFPYPFGFAPTFHRYRLDEPQRIKKPQNVFVGSMCDLFGEWVPDEWIKAVFEACKKAPQHRYLFLTKNASRYPAPTKQNDNFWYGATFTNGEEIYFFPKRSNVNYFISIEPILSEFERGGNVKDIKWVIVGAETGNRKGKVIPKREWIENIVETCHAENVPVFMKDSLKEIWGEPLIREYPWK